MGRKPSLSRFAPPSCVGPHEKEQTPPALTEDFLDGLLENESFLERLSKFMNSKKASKNGNEDNMDEDQE
ncbi:hypothetical protein HanRHA438_Chr04g0165541 [Helianthus annuus]|uniref:Uncharacterized protein n=1 Tax=Helianthus annuus TaxID=4232 RepID=A0A9K3J5I9_HELAN|nr:hypothetical protein HanXRQr2_Chr04g0155441 [Helianthus annuus]KAJ0580306.1 hypothetical protein HanHA300_Chr04g0127731 [Helianthus annuus]KAJ0596252.1 hypothetical protein HanHA89_Chr04g0140671 [Helianthus annuus]KAJ0925954.1 hypothetical protein HanRHA438_Chr04g0165541 [Helianthus annuus]KAJ0930448.1 hypothetical protein HanPSC8_Chr04g0149441 [Helianthus annuus]